jgi:hypothetical protein
MANTDQGVFTRKAGGILEIQSYKGNWVVGLGDGIQKLVKAFHCCRRQRAGAPGWASEPFLSSEKSLLCMLARGRVLPLVVEAEGSDLPLWM